MSEVLKGIRVLDFGRYIAGPFCATLLGDLGADVIRIEKVDGSEDRFLSPVTEDGAGALFMQLARNKQSLTLNPMKPEGREIVKKLVATADVVVANLPPDTLEALGLDYESLTAIKPDIILTMISAFGRGGPYSNRVGFDGLGQAMSGKSSSLANKVTSKRGSTLNASRSCLGDIHLLAPRLALVLGISGTFESSIRGGTFLPAASAWMRSSRFAVMMSKFLIAGRKSK